MKTATDLKKLIDDEIAAIADIKHDEAKMYAMIGAYDANRAKEYRKLIKRHNDEISRLRRLVIFVETSSEEGVKIMYDQLIKRERRVKASADLMKTKAQKREYLEKAGMDVIKYRLAEMKFLLE